MIINLHQISEQKISLEQAKTMCIMHEGQAFTYFDEGCTRFVYANEDRTKVIKLDKSSYSNFNETEAKIYDSAKPEVKKQMAKTKLINGLIEQEFCTPIKYGGKKLNIPQRLFAAKCRDEVGWTKEGDLVCFDLDEFLKY